jgi:hypothetical protein
VKLTQVSVWETDPEKVKMEAGDSLQFTAINQASGRENGES